MTLKGSLLTMAFVLLIGLNLMATIFYVFAKALGQGSTAPYDAALAAAWVVVGVSAIWVRGNSLLRLLLAAAPLMFFAGMIAYYAAIIS